VGFRLAFIPATFTSPHKADFDTEYMRTLFDLGYQVAAAGYAWYERPPMLLSKSESAPPKAP
jgi:hypothetical protein